MIRADSVQLSYLGSPTLAVALHRERIVAVQWPDGWKDVAGNVQLSGMFTRLPIVAAVRNEHCLLGGCRQWNANFGLPATGREIHKRITTPDGKVRNLYFRSHQVNLCSACRGSNT